MAHARPGGHCIGGVQCSGGLPLWVACPRECSVVGRGWRAAQHMRFPLGGMPPCVRAWWTRRSRQPRCIRLALWGPEYVCDPGINAYKDTNHDKDKKTHTRVILRLNCFVFSSHRRHIMASSSEGSSSEPSAADSGSSPSNSEPDVPEPDENQDPSSSSSDVGSSGGLSPVPIRASTRDGSGSGGSPSDPSGHPSSDGDSHGSTPGDAEDICSPSSGDEHGSSPSDGDDHSSSSHDGPPQHDASHMMETSGRAVVIGVWPDRVDERWCKFTDTFGELLRPDFVPAVRPDRVNLRFPDFPDLAVNFPHPPSTRSSRPPEPNRVTPVSRICR